MNIRLSLWIRFKQAVNHPVGKILPGWMKAVHAILFPVKTLCWYTGNMYGYQADTDMWIIEGLKWSTEALFTISQDGIYRITRKKDGYVLIEILTEEQQWKH